ncbi:MAG: hypothetical protein FJY85_14530 [Deltaproteobacteria bacterium]|nr:hypothetical protein [Deltaproteobacteria bacterium]
MIIEQHHVPRELHEEVQSALWKWIQGRLNQYHAAEDSGNETLANVMRKAWETAELVGSSWMEDSSIFSESDWQELASVLRRIEATKTLHEVKRFVRSIHPTWDLSD